MVVLNGWYLYRYEEAVIPEPRLCQVVAYADKQNVGVYWVDCKAHGYADIKHLTPLPEGLNNLLLSSNSQGELNE
jgi:hypothetical protein